MHDFYLMLVCLLDYVKGVLSKENLLKISTWLGIVFGGVLALDRIFSYRPKTHWEWADSTLELVFWLMIIGLVFYGVPRIVDRQRVKKRLEDKKHDIDT